MESPEFGRTVRHWRDRVRPAAVGFPVGGRRRAAGLRREEPAGLAGISVDYLTRLEQGRATSPSVQVVEALARALRVSDAERDLLFRLAGHATPGPGVVSSRITPSVQRLPDRLAHTPAAVYDATWTLTPSFRCRRHADLVTTRNRLTSNQKNAGHFCTTGPKSEENTLRGDHALVLQRAWTVAMRGVGSHLPGPPGGRPQMDGREDRPGRTVHGLGSL